jgi:hypothetical protein
MSGEPHAGSAHHHASSPVVVQHLPRPYHPPPLKPSLPVGVAVLSFLLALGGVIILLAGALVLVNSALGATIVPTSLFIAQGVDVYGAAILVVLGAAFLALARALWDLERWSLYTTVGLLFLSLTYLFFTGSVTVLFLILLVIFMYLLTVRHHFY